MTTYDADFEDHIRDLLSSLYDYLKLAENPVALRLAHGRSATERTEAIRSAVKSAILQLRREKTTSPTSRQNRLYNILLLRYVEEQGTTEVLNQLALSERQYYREHQRALQTISQVIWDQHFARAADPASLSLSEELDFLSVERSLASFEVGAELMAALRSTRVIAEQRGIDIQVEESNTTIRLNVSQPVFRQLVIYLLNDLMGAMSAGGRIGVVPGSVTKGLIIAFSGMANSRREYDRLRQDNTAIALMKSLNARLEYVAAPPQITLRFEQKFHKILIVDDNPDTIALFKRYVSNLPYQLLAAQAEDEALRIAQETSLQCIILDVMLPGKDGWQLLQRFKTHPATAQLPVLICTVLEMEELALSLGADAYLQKPPTRDELLTTLNTWI